MSAIEISIRMETDAIKFYSEAAVRTSREVGKKMFLSVGEDEKRHLAMLNTLFKGLNHMELPFGSFLHSQTPPIWLFAY